MYWRGATRNGAVARPGGRVCGVAVYLLLPSFAKSGWLPMAFVESGVFGIELLMPERSSALAMSNATRTPCSGACLPTSALCGGLAVAATDCGGGRTGQRVCRHFSSVSRAVQRASGATRRRSTIWSAAGTLSWAEQVRVNFSAYARSQGVEQIEDLQGRRRSGHFAETQARRRDRQCRRG